MPRLARLDAPGTLHHVMIRGIEEDSMIHGAMVADYNEINEISRKLAEKLSRGKEIRLLAEAGTDAKIFIENRKAIYLGGIAIEQGTFTSLSSGEAAITPLEGKTQGRFVIDFSNHQRL